MTMLRHNGGKMLNNRQSHQDGTRIPVRALES